MIRSFSFGWILSTRRAFGLPYYKVYLWKGQIFQVQGYIGSCAGSVMTAACDKLQLKEEEAELDGQCESWVWEVTIDTVFHYLVFC